MHASEWYDTRRAQREPAAGAPRTHPTTSGMSQPCDEYREASLSPPREGQGCQVDQDRELPKGAQTDTDNVGAPTSESKSSVKDDEEKKRTEPYFLRAGLLPRLHSGLREKMFEKMARQHTVRTAFAIECLKHGGVYGDVRDEYIRRLLVRETSPPPRPRTDLKAAVEHAAASLPPSSFGSPFRTTRFVSAARDRDVALTNLESAHKAWLLTSEGTDDRRVMDDVVERAIGEVQDCCDRAFGAYLTALELGYSMPRARFTKKAADEALRRALGTASDVAEGIFRMDVGVHFPMVITIDVEGQDGLARAFGLYMARKAFVVNDPREADSKTAATIRTLLSETPNPYPEIRAAQHDIIRAIARYVIGDWENGRSTARLPNSGKSCLESNRRQGGKRTALFERPDPRTASNPVVPITIVSAGKFRGISKTTVRSERHAWINSHAFQSLRKCRWMIAGRSVADWVADVNFGSTKDGPGLPAGEVFVSGDLKDATNLLSGSYADAFLDEVAHSGAYDGEDPSSVLSELQGFITKANLCEVAEFGTYKPIGIQTRGQLMASDFSFPILCLTGFLIGIETHGSTQTLANLARAALGGDITAQREFNKRVRNENRFGVNGDDFVTSGEAGVIEKRWVKAVESTAGVPEITKSPVNRRVFTVNSQCWLADADGVREVGTILPAMFLGLHANGHKPADEAWLQALSSGLATPSGRLWDELQIDVALLPDVPRTVGGLGVAEPNPVTFAERVAWGAVSCGGFVSDLAAKGSNRVIRSPFACVTRGEAAYALSGASFEQRTAVGRPIHGWFDEAELRSVIAERFDIRKASRWTSGRNKGETAEKLLSRAYGMYTKCRRWLRRAAHKALEHEREGRRYAVFQRLDGEPELTPVQDGEDVGILFTPERRARIDHCAVLTDAKVGVGAESPDAPRWSSTAQWLERVPGDASIRQTDGLLRLMGGAYKAETWTTLNCAPRKGMREDPATLEELDPRLHSAIRAMLWRDYEEECEERRKYELGNDAY